MQQAGHRPRWYLAPVLVLALVAAACGGSSDGGGGSNGGATGGELPDCPVDALESATGPVELVVWHAFVAKTKETLEALAAEYNAAQDKVRVRIESQGNDYAELWDKYQQSASSGGLPGVAILEDINTQAVADSGTVMPAQSCIDASDYDTSDLVETAADYYRIDGALYPGTVNVSDPLLYYNKNHFRRAGLDAETTPKTLDEVREYAQKIKDAGVADRPVILHMSPWFFENWLTGDGQPIVDNDNGRGDGETTAAAFDNETTVGVFTWVKQMSDDGLLTALPYRPGQIDQYLAMSEQRASMTIETSTAATSISAFLAGDTSVVEDSGEDVDPSTVDTSALDIGAGELPGINESGQVQVGGSGWYIMSTTAPEVQAAAWDFMKWWNEPAVQVRWHLEGSYMPFSKTAAEDPQVQASWDGPPPGRWLGLAYRQLVDGIDPDWPGPLIGPYDQARTAMAKGLDELLLSGKSPQEAVTGAADETTAAIEQYNQESF
jgi:sn-glycerol 3-phosphate transport system substrate-binding protein